MREINHLSVHQWIRSAIRESQQPTSPIGFLFLKLPPRLVRYYWYNVTNLQEFTGVYGSHGRVFLSFSQDKGHQVGTEGNMESVRSQGSDKHRCMILPLREDSTESTTWIQDEFRTPQVITAECSGQFSLWQQVTLHDTAQDFTIREVPEKMYSYSNSIVCL